MLINSLTPTTPSGDKSGLLKEKAFDLTKKASALLPHPPLLKTLSYLVRVMNCYYSNLIEGHSTFPYDVENAMKDNFSGDDAKRDLVTEALAHIQVQELIDEGKAPKSSMSIEFLTWCHEQFYNRLPDSMLKVEHPETGEMVNIIPGVFRDRGVKVGVHIAPDSDDIEPILNELFKRYNRCQGTDALIAIASANHRVPWVHPFIDGNGRTVRLMAHAALRDLELHTGLWSPSRGLARTSKDYKALLALADQPRQGSSTDGRGTLTEKGLVKFCDYYLSTCIDQVEFMGNLFDIGNLIKRIEKYCHEEHERSSLSPDSFALLREAIYSGEYDRGRVGSILHSKSDVTARRVLKGLVDRGLLVSDTPRGPVRLGVPVQVLAEWFPNLYPESILK